jgi:hypothetical protein
MIAVIFVAAHLCRVAISLVAGTLNSTAPFSMASLSSATWPNRIAFAAIL